jgi:hypothetical protein
MDYNYGLRRWSEGERRKVDVEGPTPDERYVADHHKRTRDDNPDPTQETRRFRDIGHGPSFQPISPGPGVHQSRRDRDDDAFVPPGAGAPLYPGLTFPNFAYPIWKFPFSLPIEHLVPTHRRELFQKVLHILERDHFRPTTWIQISNTDSPRIAFRTTTTEEVATAITPAQTKLGMIRIPEHETVLPWTIPDVDILMNHLCGHREERAIPERLTRQTADTTSDGEEADVTNPKARKRKSHDDGQKYPEDGRPTERTATTEMSPIPGPSLLPPGHEHLRELLQSAIQRDFRRRRRRRRRRRGRRMRTIGGQSLLHIHTPLQQPVRNVENSHRRT